MDVTAAHTPPRPLPPRILEALLATTASVSSDPKAPHILLVVDQFPKALGGGERALLRMAADLPAHGFRVSILTFHIHPESEVHALPIPCPIYLLPLTRTWDLHALRAAFALARFIRQQEVRIVQTFFESSDLWAGLVTTLLTPARLVWNRRDMGILRLPKHRLLYRLMRRAPALVFAVSDEVRRFTIATDRVSADRVQTLYNGIHVDPAPCILRPTPSQGAFTLATVGNIRHVKGHDSLLRAAALVVPHLPNLTVRIAGQVLDPVYFAELQALVEQLNLAPHVHFAGPVTDPAAFLTPAHLFVLPSRSEGFSNAILEAMAAGLPVIATTVGGNAEAVLPGHTGLLVPPDDPQALAAAILTLLSEPDTLVKFGHAGRSRALEYFSRDRVNQTLATALHTLLNGKKCAFKPP